MLKGLFKPKWQHKKPTVRLQALMNLEGSSDALIHLAEFDPDIDVRLSAIQQLNHIPTLKRLVNNTTEKLPKKVKQRITELTLTQPKLAELETVYHLIDDQQVHQQVVCNVEQSAAIRLQALENIDDQALLFKLADTDESRQIQFLAATKLTDYKQLQKLKRLTKTNKKFRHLLKQKNAEYQQQQDFLQHIETICTTLESLIDTATVAPDQQRLVALKEQWKQLNGEVSIAAKQRFDNALLAVEKAYTDYEQEEQKRQPLRDQAEVILHALDDLSHALLNKPNDFTQQEFMVGLQTVKTKWQALAPQLQQQLDKNECNRYGLRYEDNVLAIEQTLSTLAKDFQAIETMKQLCITMDRTLAGRQALTKKVITELEKLWSQIPTVFTLDASHYQTHYADVLHKLKQRFSQQAIQCANTEQVIDKLLKQVEKGIENDQFQKAIKVYHHAKKQLKEATGLSQSTLKQLNQRIRAATPAIRQAESWRHWGTDKAREQLTEQATHLITTTDIQPLERSKKVKALREVWKKLGKMDPSKHQRLWHEFDAACTKAYEPCQQYFNDESIQRDKNFAQRNQLCQQLETLEKETEWNKVDWRTMAKTINALQGQWRKEGNVNRANWKIVNQRFNQAMDALEVHLSKERQRNWLERQNLIIQAEAIATTLSTIEGEALEFALETAIQTGKELQAQWQPTVTAKRSEEQKLWLQFRTAIDAVYERQRSERNAVNSVLNANLQQKQALLTEVEAIAQQQGEEFLTNQNQLAAIEKQFYSLRELPRGTQQTIEKAFSKIKTRINKQREIALRQRELSQLLTLGEAYTTKQTTLDTTQQAINNALTLLLELEILLGLETPKDYQQERMKYQVERLSEQMLMASVEQKSKEEQALQKIQQWYALEKVSGDAGVIMQERFIPIKTWLEKQLNNE